MQVIRSESAKGSSVRYSALVLLLALGLLVRVIHLDAPPIGMHSWRQSDTAAIARNFHEGGYKFHLPAVDWGGARPGYVESEFPIYPFAVAAGYSFIGVREWIGRLAAALAFLIGAAVLHDLVRRTIDASTARWSIVFYLFLPLGVFYSRAFMPEAWMITSTILGVYCFHRWTESGRHHHLALAGVFVALAALIKLPSLYIGLDGSPNFGAA